MKIKDFQEYTAERVFHLFKEEGQHHVLIADEVGLGKTIIARDVIRRVSKWHKGFDDYFKVLYICSNANIAKQNFRKLSSNKDSNTVDIVSNRLSMQHYTIFMREVNHTYEEIIPMTPLTSFNLSSSGSQGAKEERALCYAVLRECKFFEGKHGNLMKLLQVQENLQRWDEIIAEKVRDVRNHPNRKYLPEMRKALSKWFRKKEGKELREDIESICSRRLFFERTKPGERRSISNRIRRMFAEISLERLEPDLVIMDEFQRFRDLIDSQPSDVTEETDTSEEKMISAKFLHDENVKVLLLSATPYKPFTTLEELSSGKSTHVDDFRLLMGFLFDDEEKRAAFEYVWDDYSKKLIELRRDNFTMLITAKEQAENELYKSICRTERTADNIIDTSKAREYPELLGAGDILSFIEAQAIMSRYHLGNFPVEYEKSAPYLLSFMHDYQTKKDIMRKMEKDREINLLKYPELLLSRKTIHGYNELDTNNMRLTVLFNECFGDDRGSRRRKSAELLLWIPASRPYYRTQTNLFEENKGYSKTLVFSSWEMVPRMIAGLTSYESERLTIGRIGKKKKGRKKKRKYFADEDKKKRSVTRRLRDAAEEVLTYPSPYLASLYSPVEYMDRSLDSIVSSMRGKVQKTVDRIINKLDLKRNDAYGAEQLIELMRVMDNGSPARLRLYSTHSVENLALIAVASPANCLYRVFRSKGASEEEAVQYAHKVAKRFVGLFNREDATSTIDVLYRSSNRDYFEKVVQYCAIGNLQAVLDEYAYILGSSGEELCEQMDSAFITTATTEIDTIESLRDKEPRSKLRMHFAVGYYNAKIDEKSVQRTESIRNAFNSPFRPFVLASTSIGQEGLDFHNYCRKIMHWNLPHNPIDLEQREGRINRYMCLSIRQNIACWSLDTDLHYKKDDDIWDTMMNMAKNVWNPGHSELVPYWSLPDSFPFNKYNRRIERIVPMYPHSADKARYDKLKGILSLYRLTLGQPRQEELLESLQNDNLSKEHVEQLSINLSPYRRKQMVRGEA